MFMAEMYVRREALTAEHAEDLQKPRRKYFLCVPLREPPRPLRLIPKGNQKNFRNACPLSPAKYDYLSE